MEERQSYGGRERERRGVQEGEMGRGEEREREGERAREKAGGTQLQFFPGSCRGMKEK